MSTADKVLRALADVAQTDEVRRDPELRLYDLGVIDSLGTVELIVKMADEFGVDISPAEVDRSQWATPARIVAYMEHRVGL
ncbi:MAG: D-alanine--poly(phosphoribitol) ligase subunit DltC [Gemmatimonadota bacterium]|nr:D-alanine--poly(phosphoribitol) ligase subunit DltC [Gemmatimonadota bacterium]